MLLLQVIPSPSYTFTSASLSYRLGIMLDAGLPRDNPESYHSYMFENFFKHIDIHPVNVNILNGKADDLEKECREYEEKIAQSNGIELFVGGAICFSQVLSFQFLMCLCCSIWMLAAVSIIEKMKMCEF